MKYGVSQELQSDAFSIKYVLTYKPVINNIIFWSVVSLEDQY
jgi:hypothetical protein